MLCPTVKKGCKVAKRRYKKLESRDLDDGVSKRKFRSLGGGLKVRAGEVRDELFQWFIKFVLVLMHIFRNRYSF